MGRSRGRIWEEEAVTVGDESSVRSIGLVTDKSKTYRRYRRQDFWNLFTCWQERYQRWLKGSGSGWLRWWLGGGGTDSRTNILTYLSRTNILTYFAMSSGYGLAGNQKHFQSDWHLGKNELVNICSVSFVKPALWPGLYRVRFWRMCVTPLTCRQDFTELGYIQEGVSHFC